MQDIPAIASLPRIRASWLGLVLLCLCATDLWAEPTLGICLPGNTEHLSSDNCSCSGALSRECIGQCTESSGFACTGATVVDPPICAGLNSLNNSSPDGCACAVDGDCTGDCTSGVCTDGVSAPVCVGLANGNNVSADGCPCTTDGDCIGACSLDTRTCEGVIGAVGERQPSLFGMVDRPVILLGESTTGIAELSDVSASASTIRFSLHPSSDATCVAPLFVSDKPVQDETPVVSDAFQPVAGGIYRWRARYRGNAWNLGAATTCITRYQRLSVVSPVFGDGFEQVP